MKHSTNLRLILNPQGSAGDVHPYLGLAEKLIGQGHEVEFISNDSFRDLVEQRGIHFHAVGEPVDWKQVSRDPKLRSSNTAWKESMGWAAINPMVETYQKITQLHEIGRTCVLSPVWSFGAKLACEKLQIPHINLVLNAMVFRSTYKSPQMPMMYLPWFMPRWMKKIEYWVADQFFIDPVLLPKLNQFRATLNLPPVRRIMHRWWFSQDLNLAMFSNWFSPNQPDWPASVKHVGHPRWDPDGDSEEQNSAVKFCQNGAAPILFVPGSVGPGGSAFFAAAAIACKNLGLRAIFLDRNSQFIPSDLGNDIKHFSFVSLRNIAHLCRAIVHSGCVGTLSHGLAAGIPHVVWPRVNDQFDNADRLLRLGVGVLLKGNQISPEKMRSALHEIVSERSFSDRAQFFATKVAQEDTYCDVVQAIEEMLEQKRLSPL